MGYPRHALLAFGGISGTVAKPQEEWSCGIRIAYDHNAAPDEDLTVDQQEEYLRDTALPALTKWWGTADMNLSGFHLLTWVKFNAISPTGHYVHEATTVKDVTPVAPGGTAQTSPTYPLQVSTVVTFHTDKNRGRASKGRIYLPALRSGLTADGLFSDVHAGNVALVTSRLIRELNTVDNSMGITFVPSVVSRLGAANDLKNPITGVSVDNRPDIQRRRAAQQNSARSAVRGLNAFP